MATLILPKQVFRLKTQRSRAKFCRKAMRAEGLNVNQLADEAGLWWGTVARFLDVCTWAPPTRRPQLETAQRIFDALGYEILFTIKGESKGVIEL